MTDILDKLKILEFGLKQIELDNSDIIKKSEKSVHCISQFLKELKEYISKNSFPTQSDDIQFFKEIKPAVYSKLIYFVTIFKIESKRPNGSDKSQKKHLKNELRKLEIFFTENLEFYQYMRNNMTFLDDKYFVRGKIDLRLYTDTFYYDADPDFSTSHDFKVAKIIANDLLCVYLNSEVVALDRRKSGNAKHPACSKNKYTWTASKNALVELIYALHASGVINEGRVDIKEIALLFENTFNIDLSDVYRTFLEIKGRNQPTKFLDTLKIALTQKIKEQLD